MGGRGMAAVRMGPRYAGQPPGQVSPPTTRVPLPTDRLTQRRLRRFLTTSRASLGCSTRRTSPDASRTVTAPAGGTVNSLRLGVAVKLWPRPLRLRFMIASLPAA